MFVTGTHFNYFHICPRKLWLFANGFSMEHTSDLVYEGKLVHETTYPQRPEQYEELEIGGCKIDFYDARNNIIHEVKKSNKIEEAHEWQLKYYIDVLEQNGINGVTGVLEYPLLRHKKHVELTAEDKDKIGEIKKQIESVVESEQCPPVLKSKICNNCSYYDFCYIAE